MILGYDRLVQLVKDGIVRPHPNYELTINAASIDVRISDKILIESPAAGIIDFDKANQNHLQSVALRSSGYLVRPRQIILASTLEMIELPNNLVAHFILKSSVGRLFFNQMQSCHADNGFRGSMTLELQNCNDCHSIRLLPYTKIGQLVFHETDVVPDHVMYNKVGQYNTNSAEPIQSKGVR